MISPSWWSQTVLVEKYDQSVASYEETGAYSERYAALPTCVAGRAGGSEQTILGDIYQDEKVVTWRAQDIDENGWPEPHDRVTLNGKVYYVKRLEDQTETASHFSIPKHKIGILSESPTTPLT